MLPGRIDLTIHLYLSAHETQPFLLLALHRKCFKRWFVVINFFYNFSKAAQCSVIALPVPLSTLSNHVLGISSFSDRRDLF